MMAGPVSDVLLTVLRERVQQDSKWGQQNHLDGTGFPEDKRRADRQRITTNLHAEQGRLQWRDILAEEFYEALAEYDEEALRTELIHVAAVAVAWVEALDRRAPAC